MTKSIRIGTRDSALALWQATHVAEKLNALGYTTEIIAIKSEGDIVLDKPLYELGITGIFTKTLDIAMLQGRIDIAVHSMKDVPTALPNGIIQAAVLERASYADLLVYNKDTRFLETEGVIATSSLRRKAQWLNKYPKHTVEDLRGNVNTRLQKLETQGWNGAIFAAAGLERIHIKPKNHLILDWMVPAPAQGAMMVVVNQDDNYCFEAVNQLNHIETEICTHIERQFLRTLEGGCTAPIAALAQYNEADDSIHFKGVLLSVDGKEKIELEKNVPIQEWKKLGYYSAKEVLENGGTALMEMIKQTLKN